jgi:hypothetical protein
MKYNKILILCGMLFITCSLSAQKDKSSNKPHEQIEEMNSLITSIDQNLSLSEDQKSKMMQLFTKRNEDIKLIKEGQGTEIEKEEKIKVVRQKVYTTLSTEIFTKEQKKARETAMIKKKK